MFQSVILSKKSSQNYVIILFFTDSDFVLFLLLVLKLHALDPSNLRPLVFERFSAFSGDHDEDQLYNEKCPPNSVSSSTTTASSFFSVSSSPCSSSIQNHDLYEDLKKHSQKKSKRTMTSSRRKRAAQWLQLREEEEIWNQILVLRDNNSTMNQVVVEGKSSLHLPERPSLGAACSSRQQQEDQNLPKEMISALSDNDTNLQGSPIIKRSSYGGFSSDLNSLMAKQDEQHSLLVARGRLHSWPRMGKHNLSNLSTLMEEEKILTVEENLEKEEVKIVKKVDEVVPAREANLFLCWDTSNVSTACAITERAVHHHEEEDDFALIEDNYQPKNAKTMHEDMFSSSFSSSSSSADGASSSSTKHHHKRNDPPCVPDTYPYRRAEKTSQHDPGNSQINEFLFDKMQTDVFSSTRCCFDNCAASTSMASTTNNTNVSTSSSRMSVPCMSDYLLGRTGRSLSEQLHGGLRPNKESSTMRRSRTHTALFDKNGAGETL